MELERAIADLLYRHDCVIVPELGAFIAQRSSARFAEEDAKFYPPSKEIAFNEVLQSQDGLLADYLAQREEIAFEEAARRVTAQVKVWREALSEGRYVRLSGIGKLSLGAEASIQFHPARTVNYLRDSFGLPSVSAETLIQERERAIKPWPRRLKHAAVWLSVAALSSFSLYHLSDQPSAAERDQATLNPFAAVSSPPRAERPPAPSLNARRSAPAVRSKRSATTEPLRGAEQALNTEPTAPARRPVVLHHQLIAGAFSIPANARRLAARLKGRGYDAQLAGKLGRLTLVSTGRFASKADAMRAYYEMRKTLPKIWYRYQK